MRNDSLKTLRECKNVSDQLSDESVYFHFSGLNFYQQVKLVNFIRRQIHQCRCYGCHVRFKSKADLRTHMAEAKHTSLLPEMKTWDQPE